MPQRICLRAGRLSVVIDPALGASIADFSMDGPHKFSYPLMRRASEAETSPSSMASFVMAPWCNRVARASMNFRGRSFPLRNPGSDGHAIHGDARSRPFTILDRAPCSASLALDSRMFHDINFPFAFVLTLRFELQVDRLIVDTTLANADREPMPAAFGHHPYFMRRLWSDDDDVLLQFPNSGRYPLSNSIPTAPAAPDALSKRFLSPAALPSEPINDCFVGFNAPATITWPASGVRLRIAAEPPLSHIVLYTPREKPHAITAPAAPSPASVSTALPWFAFEPSTACNDAFNLLASGWTDTGAAVLEPGESLAARCEYLVELL